MHKASTDAKCCPEFDPLIEPVDCFLPDVCKGFQRLLSRHRRMVTKRRRLLGLAEPKRVIRRFVPKCPCDFSKHVHIIRLETSMRTRTEQLAYPQAWKLLLFKNTIKKKFPPQQLETVNRLIRKSLFSMYSRLANVQPPKMPVPVHKWNAKEWRVHRKYLKKLAKPKVPPRMPRLPKDSMPLQQMRRYKKLAKPKRRDELLKEEWVLTPEIKFYKPSERIEALAKSAIRDEEALHQTLPLEVNPNALRHKASARILELATATHRRAGELDVRENPFGVSPNALKAKPSKRTKELAEPKEYEDIHLRENPNFISPAALTAKASPRIVELAKPKGS